MPRESRSPYGYYFVQTPIPLLRTRRVSDLAKRVWSCVYTHLLFPFPDDYPIEALKRYTGACRRELDRALVELEVEGLLASKAVEKSGEEILEFELLWPEWIQAEGEGLEIKDTLIVEEDEDEDPR